MTMMRPKRDGFSPEYLGTKAPRIELLTPPWQTTTTPPLPDVGEESQEH
jgi:hypothetical protein